MRLSSRLASPAPREIRVTFWKYGIGRMHCRRQTVGAKGRVLVSHGSGNIHAITFHHTGNAQHGLISILPTPRRNGCLSSGSQSGEAAAYPLLQTNAVPGTWRPGLPEDEGRSVLQ